MLNIQAPFCLLISIPDIFSPRFWECDKDTKNQNCANLKSSTSLYKQYLILILSNIYLSCLHFGCSGSRCNCPDNNVACSFYRPHYHPTVMSWTNGRVFKCTCQNYRAGRQRSTCTGYNLFLKRLLMHGRSNNHSCCRDINAKELIENFKICYCVALHFICISCLSWYKTASLDNHELKYFSFSYLTKKRKPVGS